MIECPVPVVGRYYLHPGKQSSFDSVLGCAAFLDSVNPVLGTRFWASVGFFHCFQYFVRKVDQPTESSQDLYREHIRTHLLDSVVDI